MDQSAWHKYHLVFFFGLVSGISSIHAAPQAGTLPVPPANTNVAAQMQKILAIPLNCRPETTSLETPNISNLANQLNGIVNPFDRYYSREFTDLVDNKLESNIAPLTKRICGAEEAEIFKPIELFETDGKLKAFLNSGRSDTQEYHFLNFRDSRGPNNRTPPFKIECLKKLHDSVLERPNDLLSVLGLDPLPDGAPRSIVLGHLIQQLKSKISQAYFKTAFRDTLTLTFFNQLKSQSEVKNSAEKSYAPLYRAIKECISEHVELVGSNRVYSTEFSSMKSDLDIKLIFNDADLQKCLPGLKSSQSLKASQMKEALTEGLKHMESHLRDLGMELEVGPFTAQSDEEIDRNFREKGQVQNRDLNYLASATNLLEIIKRQKPQLNSYRMMLNRIFSTAKPNPTSLKEKRDTQISETSEQYARAFQFLLAEGSQKVTFGRFRGIATAPLSSPPATPPIPRLSRSVTEFITPASYDDTKVNRVIMDERRKDFSSHVVEGQWDFNVKRDACRFSDLIDGFKDKMVPNGQNPVDLKKIEDLKKNAEALKALCVFLQVEKTTHPATRESKTPYEIVSSDDFSKLVSDSRFKKDYSDLIQWRFCSQENQFMYGISAEGVDLESVCKRIKSQDFLNAHPREHFYLFLGALYQALGQVFLMASPDQVHFSP